MKKYFYLFLFLCGINGLPVFGTSFTETDQQPEQKFQVKIKNQVREADFNTMVNQKRLLIEEGQSTKTQKLPYILVNPDDSRFSYITNIELMVTLLFKNGRSSTKTLPLQRDKETLIAEFLFEDKEQLDRISAQVQGIAFIELDLRKDKSQFIGDYRHITLGGAWHPVQPGTRGWLYQDHLLCAHFYQGQLEKQPYKLEFGNKF
ncbi:MAG: hypothetical protein BGO76_03335 [Caedibacter sp. 38-128]|nr:hypothetical protein [Holosporales bacterium]OJX05398.1 MAG: hypothetical protein BGO76_03335 [Caedibacter sp. 38-128]